MIKNSKQTKNRSELPRFDRAFSKRAGLTLYASAEDCVLLESRNRAAMLLLSLTSHIALEVLE